MKNRTSSPLRSHFKYFKSLPQARVKNHRLILLYIYIFFFLTLHRSPKNDFSIPCRNASFLP